MFPGKASIGRSLYRSWELLLSVVVQVRGRGRKGKRVKKNRRKATGFLRVSVGKRGPRRETQGGGGM